MLEFNKAYTEEQLKVLITMCLKPYSEFYGTFEVSLQTRLHCPEMRIEIAGQYKDTLIYTSNTNLKITLTEDQAEMFRSFIIGLLEFPPLQYEDSITVKRLNEEKYEFNTPSCYGTICRRYDELATANDPKTTLIEVFGNYREDNFIDTYIDMFVRNETADLVEVVEQDNEESITTAYTFYYGVFHRLWLTWTK